MTLVSADSAFRQYEVSFPYFGLELWSPGNPLFPRPEIETIAVKPEQFLETIATLPMSDTWWESRVSFPCLLKKTP